jgi:hypothetical protein
MSSTSLSQLLQSFMFHIHEVICVSHLWSQLLARNYQINVQDVIKDNTYKMNLLEIIELLIAGFVW